MFGAVGWQLDFVTLRVLLPVGISFYTFVTMSYVIDVYRREIPATRDLVDFAVFVAYFPAPGRRADPARRRACCRRSHNPRTITPRADAGRRVAGRLGLLPEDLRRGQPAPVSPTRCSTRARRTPAINVLLGVYAFAFQIYGDFAGYSNIARGISKLMGIELLENSASPTSCARRRSSGATGTSACRPGCATTSTSRSAATADRRGRRDRNLLITMVLGGLWHGAAWTFVLWGLYHGLLLIAYRTAGRLRDRAAVAAGAVAVARVAGVGRHVPPAPASAG